MRRKKNAMVGKKTPIEFLESPPLHVPLRPATPVHSSLCPLTADVIPVGVADNVWISPQFHGNAERTTRSGRKHLLSRGPSNHETSRIVCNASTLVPKTQYRDRRSLFRPLHFVNERTSNEKTTVSKFCAIENNSPRPHSLSAENSSATSDTLARAAQCTTAPLMTESQAVACVQFEVDTPDIDWEDLNRTERCRKSSTTRVIGAEMSNSSDASRSPAEDNSHADQRRRNLLADMSVARAASPARRCASDDFDKNPSSAHCRSDNRRKQNGNVRDILSSLMAMTPPSSSGQDSSETVLVLDTPVSDYGLSYRQRALRNGRVYLRDSVVRT